MKLFAYLLIALLVSCFISCEIPIAGEQSGEPVIQWDFPKIVLSDTSNRRFAFTNKNDGFFLGNTHRDNTNGWFVNGLNYLRDYQIIAGDRVLDKKQIRRFVYLPYGYRRFYGDGLREEFILLDSLNAFVLKISPRRKEVPLKLRLNFPGNVPQEYISLEKDKPHFTVPAVKFVGTDSSQRQSMTGYFQQDAQGNVFVVVQLDTQFANVEPDSISLAEQYAPLIQKRKKRLSKLLERHSHQFNDPKMNRTLTWTNLALDALITGGDSVFIRDGLPWQNARCARSNFIAFDGALLSGARYKQAGKILRDFAAKQLTDQGDRRLGRIPKSIDHNSAEYDAADVTWWFVRSLYNYYLISADTVLLKELYPVVKRALNGALLKRVDSNGFLLHGDAETWMDRTNLEGACSPRGNRAVEIQALWYTALRIGTILARNLRKPENEWRRWQEAAATLKINFNERFWNEQSQSLFDRLHEDGRPDSTLRPNQIFALTVPDMPGIPDLLPPDRQRCVARKVTEALAFEHGVATLWPEDNNFHPYLHYLPYYLPAKAYHNGTVFSWLTSPLISALIDHGQDKTAAKLYLNQASHILNRGAPGHITECLDAAPRAGQNFLAATGRISESMALAGFRENLCRDFIGYQSLAARDSIFIRPRPNEKINYVGTDLPYKKGKIEIELEKESATCTIKLQSHVPAEQINGLVFFEDAEQPVHFCLSDSGEVWRYQYIPAEKLPREFVYKRLPEKDYWSFAQIDTTGGYALFNRLDHVILEGSDVYFPLGENGRTILYKRDRLNDDKGPNARYTYPGDPIFADGIFDIDKLTVYDAGDAWGFRLDLRNLVDPGWNEAFGFQLTYAAIAIANPGIKGERTAKVGKQANYRLPANRKFNRIIYIGGGYEVHDAGGNLLARYAPVDSDYPIGFVHLKQIRFKVPKVYLSELSAESVVTVLVGGQDDYGGGGLGAFRALKPQAGPWHGGGAWSENAPRVYDILEIN